MPIKIKPVIVAEDGVNEFKDSKSKIKTVIVAEDGINTVKKKEPTVLPSGQNQESTTSVTPKVTEQKPSVSSSSKGEGIFEFKGRPGAIYKKKADGLWAVDVNNTGIFKDITDPKRIDVLEKQATPTFRAPEERTAFEVAPKPEAKKELTREEKQVQKDFSKDFKVLAKTDPTVIAKNKEDKEAYNLLNKIDSDIIASSEGEVVPKLKSMFKGTENDIFDFEETGAGYDAIKVTNRLTGKSQEFSLDNWSSGRDNDESKLLKGFLDVELKFKDQAYNQKRIQELEKLKENQLPIDAMQTQAQIDELRKDVDIDDKLKQNYAVNTGKYAAGAVYNKEAVNNTKAKFARANIDAVELKTQKADLDEWKKQADKSLTSGAITQEEYDNVYMPKIVAEESDIRDKALNIQSSIDSLKRESGNLDVIAANHIISQEDRGNFLTGTVKSFIKGVESPFLTIITQNMDNPAEAKRLILEATAPGIVTDEYLKSANRNDFETAVFGLAESIGSNLAGGPAGNASMFVSAYGNYKDELNATPGMENVPEYEKMLLSAGLAAPASIIEKFGIDKIMQKSPIGKKFTNWILSKTISSLPKKASSEMLEKAIAENLKSAIARGIVNVAADGAIEGFSEGAEQLVEGGTKELYDLMKGKDYFDNPKTVGGWLDNIGEAAKLGAIGGASVGAITQSLSIASDKRTAVDFNKIANAIEDDNLKDIIKTSLKAKVLSGEISKMKATEIVKNMESSETILKQIPSSLKPEDKYNAFNLIEEKSNLTKEIAGKDEALVSKQKERINAINEELKAISNKPVEDANKESEQPKQEVSTESNISEYQGAESGQQEVGQAEGSERTTTQPEANNSDSNIASEETQVNNNEEQKQNRRVDLFPETSEFGRVIGNANADAELSSYNEVNGIGFAEYTNTETGIVDVIMTGTSDNDYVGYVRVYENGKPTNRFTSKMENKSGNKADFKNMLSEAQRRLPSDHEYTESTSISTDGLRVYERQLSYGYDYALDENGNRITNTVAINGDSKQNILGIDVNLGGFDNISVTNNSQFESVKKALAPLMSKLGMNENNIHWENGTVTIDLPVLRKKSTQQTEAQNKKETATIAPTTQVEQEENADVKSATDAIELAKMYNEEVNSLSSVNPKEKAIHSVISKVKRDSYIQFGDANNITNGLAKTYFRKDGQSIDQVAQDASALLSDDTSVDVITPQDIIEYINKYQGGFNPATPKGNARLKAINERHIELTGKKLDSRIAKTRAMNVGKEVELEQVESKLYAAIETAGLLSTMDENINDESFWTTFPGGFTKEEYELIKKEYNETSREELERIESEIQSITNWDSEDAIISTDAIEEGTTEATTFEEVKDLDVTDKSNLQKVQSFLDNAINDLDAFGKETLGMNLPVAVARAVLKTVKTLVDAGVSLEKAFKQASQEAGVSEIDVIDAIKLVKESYKAGAAKATGDLKPIIEFLKDKAKLTKNAKTGLALAVKDLVKSGKINSVQSASIVKRFNSVNTARQESIDNFLAFVERVYNRADYAQKFTEAASLKKSINKARKNTAGSVNAIAKEFGKIDLSIVSDIDKYIEIATELKNATKPNRTQTSSSITGITQTFDTEISSRKAISIEDLQKYIEGELNKQEKQQLERAKKRYEEYVTDGSLPKNITLEEVNALMKELKGKIEDAEFEAKAESIASVIKKEFLDRKSIVEDMIVNGGVNPLTGEQIDFTPEQEALIKKLLSIDTETLSKKEMFVALDGMDNFLTNGITDGLKKFVAIQEGRASRTELINSGIKARDLKMYFNNALARFKFKQLDDVNKTLERMFGGISKGDKVAKALGFTKVRNGVAKTDKQVNNINQAFTAAFKGKRPNGKHFNDASNTYERGVYADLLRSPVGSVFAKAEALKKGIEEAKATYENLMSSTDKQKQKEGKLVKAVFDKLNLGKENITIEEIAENVAKENRDGVDWMINKWSELYPDMADKSLGFDNVVLDQEDNYTPDVVRSVIPEPESSLGENITQTNPFVNDPNKRVNTSKAGVLHASTKARMGKSKYLSYDFDNNNIKKMREALLDLNISEGAYQMQEALKNNEELIKLIPNAADMDMIRRKMYAYVNNAKGSTIKDSIDIKLADNILNRLAKASTSMGLSAISQIPTQTIGVAMNTMAQAGEFWELGAAFNKDVNDFIDRTGRPIANRGKEATTTIESATRYIEKNPDAWYKTIDKTVNDVNDAYLDFTLQMPDRKVARASFIAYYKKSLKRQGLNYKNLDWKNLEVNDEAADYAETMVSRQQTTSDPYNKGAVFTNKMAVIKFLKNTLLPFAGFSINQHSRMVNDIVTITQRHNEATIQDKIDARRSLAGWMFEQLAYHSVNYAIIQGIYWAMSDEDEEDQKKRRAFEKDTRLTKIIGDILSPLPQVNDIINGGINYALESKFIGSFLGVNEEVDKQIDKIKKKMLEEKDEVMGAKEEFAKRKELQQELSYQLKTFDNKNPYGLYGVAYDKFHDFELLFGDKYTGEVEVSKYGGDGIITKYLIPEDRDKLLAPMVIDALYLSGAVRLRELHKYSTIKRKELENKRSLTAKEYDIYSELKKDKKFDPNSYQFDLIKSGKDKYWIQDEIKWINENGGLDYKEGSEYNKLRELYIKDKQGYSVNDDDLKMLQQGKTAEHIFNKSKK